MTTHSEREIASHLLPSFLSPTVYYFCCPGYNTGKRTDEWVARQRREVRVEKFSQVHGRLVNHSQNSAIASYANISEYLVSSHHSSDGGA